MRLPAARAGRDRLRRMLAAVLLASVAVPVHAAQRPLWEIGFGVAPLTVPDYRGSDEQRNYVLPLPYLVYRGDFVTVDRHGVAGHVLRNRRIRLSVSLNAGVPVKSSGNDARAGMPDLYPTLEAGPVLDVCLDPVCRREPTWSFSLPARAVIATDLRHTRYIGWVFNPAINYDTQLLLGAGRWNFGAALGPVFATAQQNVYYYQVDPAYVTPTRPAYAARGGYGGMRMTIGVSRRFRSTWFGAFVRYDNLSGAVFENSPLVRVRNSFMAGFGIAWIFAHSAAMVPVRP
ncbi:MAG: MipA/OmpV family protein [Acidiferrobacterales bacterium]